MEGTLLAACSCISAGIGGAAAFSAIRSSRSRKSRRRRFAIHAMQVDPERSEYCCDGFAAKVLDLSQKASRETPATSLPRAIEMFEAVGSERFAASMRTAGLESSVTVAGLSRARARLAIGLGLFGAFAGAVASNQLAVLLGYAGAALGWSSVGWALRQETAARRFGLERHLSELIEVMCLGLRSGLSFDRALGLYCDCFSTSLGRELRLAQSQWYAGLRTRDGVLRDLAATYDSPLFARMIESIIRSMRFGSPLADSLDILATEARQVHKAQIQEKVMKAPVKMMVPVGTLILPSMLILVLGPVLLDLIEGF